MIADALTRETLDRFDKVLDLDPTKRARYLEELAGLYHRWYDNCRVIPQGDDPIESVHRTRLWLNDAAGQVFRNGLALLGVSAPERM